MKRFFLILVSLLLCASVALAEPLTLAEDLTGELTAEDTDYHFSIRLPQVAGDDDLAQTINNIYQMELSEQLEFKAPIKAEVFAMDGATGFTEIGYRVSCNSEDFLSVIVTTREVANGMELLVQTAHVFPRSGPKAGLVISLPYLLGLLEGTGESDTWLEERQTEKANACVRRLIWERIEADSQRTYYDGLDETVLAESFYPEEDFYMDEDGALVFFVQPGLIADPEVGVLEWRFTMDELLDEI